MHIIANYMFVEKCRSPPGIGCSETPGMECSESPKIWLRHHKVKKVNEFFSKNGHKWVKHPFWCHFWISVPISLHLVVNFFWTFIFRVSSKLPNTSRKPHFRGKSGCGCLFCMSIDSDSSNTAWSSSNVWTTWNLDWMYSQVANRRVFLINGGGAEIKMEKFTLIHSRTTIDKANRWIR